MGGPDRPDGFAPPELLAAGRSPRLQRGRSRYSPTQMLSRSPAATTGPVGWPLGEPPAGSTDTARTSPLPSLPFAAGATASLHRRAGRDDAHRNRGVAALDHPELEIAAGVTFSGDMTERDLARGGIVDDEIADIAAIRRERGDQFAATDRRGRARGARR